MTPFLDVLIIRELTKEQLVLEAIRLQQNPRLYIAPSFI